MPRAPSPNGRPSWTPPCRPICAATSGTFLYALLKDHHIGLLPEIIADLARFAEGGPETLVARVTSAAPLTAEEQAAFRQRIAATYGQGVEVEFRVDASLLGGAIVQVGDKIIDGSIAGKLNALHSRLVAAR
jgi:F-type H+-transporting ATPase subunit delta